MEPIAMPGQLAGLVTNPAGVPQMGATVLLFNRYERLIGRGITNDRGAFDFSGLPSDVYSMRVTLASFVPAVKRNIAVQSGMRSYLAVNLASLLSTVELVYMAPGQGAVMSEDWKWVLRGAGATRPVLRIIPNVDVSDPTLRRRAAVFNDTRGMLRVSAGDGGASSAAGSQADLGTAFALATSLFGSHQLEVSGNVGYASGAGIPLAGFRTSYAPDVEGFRPHVDVTMRQMFLGHQAGLGLVSGNSGAPALRTMEATVADRRQVGDDLEVEYGATLESVSFLQRLNYASPFARARWGTEEWGMIEVGYSSGAPALSLMSGSGGADGSLNSSLSSLSLFPRVSLAGGAARVQRTDNMEVGYRRVLGSRSVAFSVYRESVSNSAMTMSGAEGFYSQANLLPDLASSSSVFNIGSYRRMGYLASFSQQLGENLVLTGGYGYGGALEAPGSRLSSDDPGELRSGMRRAQRHALSARVGGVIPRTGTAYWGSYQWTDYRVLSPMHFSMIQRTMIEPGLNLAVRQPVPALSGVFPGRLEATAELRNLLAQGYVPVYTMDGRRLLLIHSPRAIRGGLSFTF